MGAPTFGTWLVLFGLLGYLALLDFGFSSAILRHVASSAAVGQPTNLRWLLRRASRWVPGIFLAMLAVGAGVGLALPSFVDTDLSRRLLTVVALALALRAGVLVVASVLGGAVRGVGRGDLVDASSAVTTALGTVVVLGLLEAGHGLVSLAVGPLVAAILHLAFLLWQASRRFSQEPATPNSATPRGLVVFSMLVLVNMVAGRLVFQTDAVVAGSVLSASAAAVYALTFRTAELGILASFRIGDVAYPFLAGPDRSHNANLFLASLRGTTAVATMCAVAIVLLTRRFVSLWVGPDQYGGLLLAAMFAAMVLHHAVLHVGAVALYAANRLSGIVWASVAEAALNLGASILFAWIWGLPGIAFATLLAGLLTSGWYIPYKVARTLEVPVRRQLQAAARPLATGLFAGLLVAWAEPWFDPTWTGLVSVAMLLFAVSAVGFWFAGSTQADRQTLVTFRGAA